MTDISNTSTDVAIDYHERTTHYPNRYARSLGFLDWENQPNPFRRFEGGALIDKRPATIPAYDHLTQSG